MTEGPFEFNPENIDAALWHWKQVYGPVVLDETTLFRAGPPKKVAWRRLHKIYWHVVRPPRIFLARLIAGREWPECDW